DISRTSATDPHPFSLLGSSCQIQDSICKIHVARFSRKTQIARFKMPDSSFRFKLPDSRYPIQTS
ncbi:hypothetical protein BGZ96_010687, partial [Linnemannia gamsii]